MFSLLSVAALKSKLLKVKMKIDTGSEFINRMSYLTESDFVTETMTPLHELKKLASEGVMRAKMELFVTNLQSIIVNQLSRYEPVQKFRIDRWNRAEGGGGISSVLQSGKVFEKAGVNISVVHGNLNEQQAVAMRSRGKDIRHGKNTFFATGISCVLHPTNPFVPTLHFNYRYFEVLNENDKNHTWWFGGGCDLTPYYLSDEDVIHFHSCQKEACDKTDELYYPRFKKWADEYFYNVHQAEHRGVGGIFFDDFDERSLEECFNFIVTCGNAIMLSYLPIVDRRKDEEYTKKNRDWQLIRRGRYVEFNLVYDRGTKFGLATPGARIESVLMSLPLYAMWDYNPQIAHGSEEEKLVKVLKKCRDWV